MIEPALSASAAILDWFLGTVGDAGHTEGWRGQARAKTAPIAMAGRAGAFRVIVSTDFRRASGREAVWHAEAEPMIVRHARKVADAFGLRFSRSAGDVLHLSRP